MHKKVCRDLMLRMSLLLSKHFSLNDIENGSGSRVGHHLFSRSSTSLCLLFLKDFALLGGSFS